MTDEQKIIAEGLKIYAKDLGSHKKAIESPAIESRSAAEEAAGICRGA
jgi:hypothetical protein